MWGESRVIMRLIDASLAEGAVASELARWLAPRVGGGTVAAASRALGKPVWETVWRLVDRGALDLEIVPPDTGEKRVSDRLLVLADHVPGLLERDALFRRSPKQRQLLELLETLGGTAAVKELREREGISDAVMKGLVDRGLARVGAAERIRDPFAGIGGTPPPAVPTPGQQAAITAIDALGAGEAVLLQGVTGSGKTFVYLEAVQHALADGRGAIVLVPEIALTPQTVSRFRGVFGDQVAVLHSGLSDGERADAWRLLRRGERRVAVGARSAIFAPVRQLGLIVIDEEHETSYKNGEAPRYHARDVAMVRARLERARVVLGSATPSLESQAQAGNTLQLLRLPDRIEQRPMPPVELVDLRNTALVLEAAPVPWSESLDAALGAALANREQALLLLNRRGLRLIPAVPVLRRRGRLPELQHCPHGASRARGAALPLLRSPGADAFPLCRVWWCGAGGTRRRHPAARAPGGRALSCRASGAHGPRHHQWQGGAPAHPRLPWTAGTWTSCSAPR